MKRVVERCPNCGVEHDDARGGPCEVCGTTLRYWCRVHSKEIGWLEAPECPRCAAEAQARAPRPAPTPAPRRAPAEVPPRAPTRVPPRRPPPIVVEPAPPEWAGGPPAAEPPPYAGRDPRDVVRDGAEELRPYVVTGAGVALRLVRALMAIIRSVIGWGVLGGLAGAAFGYYQDREIMWAAMFGVMIGGGAGLLLGLIAALRILFASPVRRE